MRRYQKRQDDVEEASWMTTYSDLVTLLLTFFVLLFSMASIDNQKFEEIKKSLKSSFIHWSAGDEFDYNKGEDMIKIMPDSNPLDDGMKNVDNSLKEFKEIYTQAQLEQAVSEVMTERAEALKSDMQQQIDDMGLTDYITVVREVHNVILRIESLVLFDLGKAEIKDSGKVVLDNLSRLLSTVENEILIQGHTDDLPINTLIFPSNWELSTKRATNVCLYFIENCSISPDKLTATGNGEYKPVVPNDSDENRQRNRRIDIVLAQSYFAASLS